MAYFPHAFKKMLVATSATTPPFPTDVVNTPADTLGLTAGQVAIVDSKTNSPIDTTNVPAIYGAGAGEFSQVYLAQGSFYTNDKIGPFHGGYQETVKSKGINPKYVSQFYVTEPADAVNEVVEVCTNECQIDCDTVYDLRIDIKGSPVLRFLTHNLYQTLSYKTPCCDDAANPIDPMLVLLGWADQINGGNSIFTNGSGNATSPFLNQFIQAVVWFNAGDPGVNVATSGVGAVNEITLSAALTGAEAGDRITIDGVVYYIETIDGPLTTLTLVDINGTPVDTAAASLVVVTLLETVETSETYTAVVGAGATAVNGCIQILGAYVDTVFGDCSFNPKDHFEKEPIKIYASAASYANNSNDLGDNRCEVSCFEITRTQEAVQGKGYGETLVRELILVKGYRQENWYDDPRMREVTLDTVLSSSGGTPEIARAGSYVVYHILHSIPRKSNPSGTFDNDQYLVKIVATRRDNVFETWINKFLISANNAVQLEVVA